MSAVEIELSRFMVFWAHYDGFFAKFSFTIVHLLLAVMDILSLSLMKFKYTLNLEASMTIEYQMNSWHPTTCLSLLTYLRFIYPFLQDFIILLK
jgi:hypothetical protein